MNEEEDIQGFEDHSKAKFDFIPISAELIAQLRKIQGLAVSYSEQDLMMRYRTRNF